MSPVSASHIAGKIELPAVKEKCTLQGEGMFEIFDDVPTRNYNFSAL